MARVAPKPWEEAYRLQGRLWRGARLDDATRALLETRPQLRTVPWLEVGCGDGKGIVPLAQVVRARVVGLDASRQALRLTVRAASEEATVVACVQADLRHPPFRAGSFGALRAVHVLGHLRADGRAEGAKALVRAVRPGGTALFMEFTTGDFRAGTGDEVEPRTFRRGHGIETHYFGPGELEGLVASAGLVLDEVREDRFFVRYHGIDRERSRVVVVASAPAHEASV